MSQKKAKAPTKYAYWECCCCYARDWHKMYPRRRTEYGLISPHMPACDCPPRRCGRCNQCELHCQHPCVECGKPGQGSWFSTTGINGQFFPMCNEHLERWREPVPIKRQAGRRRR